MGNTIETYRAAIGTFYAVTHRQMNRPVLKLNIVFHLYCTLNIFCLLSLTSFVQNDQYKFYRLILLLMCMDVHSNPGPFSNDSDISSLEIFQLNTRSIRNKLEYIHTIAESFHILCFCETHLDDNINTNDLILERFDEPIRKDRTHNGGGVAVYVSNMLRHTRRVDLENPRLETIWVEIKLKTHNILVCCFYRSDFVVSQSVFVTEMQSSIEEALDYTPYVILTGDINIDFLNLTNV